MPIFHKYKVIFVHIPKTAGTTINDALGIHELFPSNRSLYEYDANILYGIQEDIELDHLTANDIHKQVSNNIWNTYFKCAFIRNPYDRMVSQYFYAIQYKDYRMLNKRDFATFESFVNKLYELYKSNSLDKFKQIEKNHYISQYDYLYNSDNNCLVDFIGKFETFCTDVETFLNRTVQPQLKESFLKKKQSSKHETYDNYYTYDLKKKIYEIYKLDFITFGYDSGLPDLNQ
jgi:hypothetical protein